jgi:plastocyanin
MRRPVRALTAAALAVTIALGLQGQAWAVTRDVSIAEFAFQPPTIRPAMGVTVRWSNEDAAIHTSTSDTTLPNGRPGILVWDSGNLGPSGVFSFDLPWASTFTYHCTRHPDMTGRVAIRPRIVDVSTQDAVRYRIVWAVADSPEGLQFDVQIRRPGAGQVFSDWRNGFARSAVFRPHRDGTFGFRSRLVKEGGGAVQASTGRSPAALVTVMLP